MENNAKILFFSKSKPFKESFFHLKNIFRPGQGQYLFAKTSWYIKMDTLSEKYETFCSCLSIILYLCSHSPTYAQA